MFLEYLFITQATNSSIKRGCLGLISLSKDYAKLSIQHTFEVIIRTLVHKTFLYAAVENVIQLKYKLLLG